MGYAIELSFDVRKQRSLVTTTEEREELAVQFGCEMQYFMHEIEGKGRRILRNDGIQVVLFREEDVDSLLEFIRVVRRDRSTYVECVYRDDCTCELLYAAPKYLQRMDKNLARIFKRKLKSRTTGTPLEEHILAAMRRR
jgi:hypothetical protein